MNFTGNVGKVALSLVSRQPVIMRLWHSWDVEAFLASCSGLRFLE